MRRRLGRGLRYPYRLIVSPSGILWLLPDQALSPFRFEHLAPLRIFVGEVLRIDHAIGAETAEILAQLAPRREDPHRFVIADRDRPDGALAVAAVLVAITQRDLPAFMNLRARPRHVD